MTDHLRIIIGLSICLLITIITVFPIINGNGLETYISFIPSFGDHIILNQEGSNDCIRKQDTISNVGMTIDLNLTTGYYHPDLVIDIEHENTEYVIDNEFIDIEGDGNKDLVLYVRNVTYHGESYDIRSEIWTIEGPLLENKTYDDEITKWIYPNETWNPYLMDIGSKGKYDLVIVDEGSEFHNGSVMIYPLGDDPSNPWKESSCTIEISNEDNGTAYDVQGLDIDQDGKGDLLVHKEISYVYTTPPPPGSDQPVNHSKLKKSLLILNGDITPSGERNESYFSTIIDSDWSPGPGNTTFTGKFHMLKQDDSYSIICSDWLYIMPYQTDHTGRIFSFDPIDLNGKSYNLSKIITHDIRDLSSIGSIGSVNSLSSIELEHKHDFLMIRSGGFKFLPLEILIENKIKPTLKDCIFFTADAGVLKTGDFNGDNVNDIFCSFPYHSISTRQYCGAINIGLDYSRFSGWTDTLDLQDISILGAESSSRLGSLSLGFFVDDIDNDGYDDVIMNQGGYSFTYSIVKGRGQKAPVVEDVDIKTDPIYRGGSFDLEIFGHDPQNYPKYLDYEIQIRESGGDWSPPSIVDTEINWSDEKPYLGSTIFTIDVPFDFEIGPFDIRVRATNTFNLTSEWYEFPSIGEITNSPPTITAMLDKNVVESNGILNIIGTVTDIDSTGPFELHLEISDGPFWKLDRKIDIDENNFVFSIPFQANGTLIFGLEYQLRLKVFDTQGDFGISKEMGFHVRPNNLYLNITEIGSQVFRGNDLIISYEMYTQMEGMDLIISSDPDIEMNFTISPGTGSINIPIQLDSDLGNAYFNYTGNDGYWNLSGKFNTEILNNPPWIDIPLDLEVIGSESLILDGMFGDLEDIDDLILNVHGDYNGLKITYYPGNNTIQFEIEKDGIYFVTLNVTDHDGAVAIDTFKVTGITGEEEPLPYYLNVRVTDHNGMILPNALVSIYKDGILIGSNNTDVFGVSNIRLDDFTNILVKVDPPSELAWIDGIQSGLTRKEIDVEFPTTSILVQLDYREVIQSKNGTLTVNLKDERGLPIADATVEISGPIYMNGITDASGSVFFIEVVPGTYTVVVLAPDEKIGRETVTIGENEDKILDMVVNQKSDEKDNDLLYYIIPAIIVLVILILLASVWFYTSRSHIEGINEE